MPCLVPGCGQKVLSKGLCARHYKAWQRAGKPTIGEWVGTQLAAEAKATPPAPETVSADPMAAAEMDMYRWEWEEVAFSGSPETVSRKREILAHLEGCFFPIVACDRAHVRRREYQQWLIDDPEFLEATKEATAAFRQRTESMMVQIGSGKKPNVAALFGWLNMYAGWNPMSRAVDQMRNAKFVESFAKRLRERLPADLVGPVLDELSAMAGRAASLPPGSKL